uniref:Unannotated protein n=1 Tax=freshwater metagenome TaxID=449393 RepID=A0A6J5Z3E7_9ZZZZ
MFDLHDVHYFNQRIRKPFVADPTKLIGTTVAGKWNNHQMAGHSALPGEGDQ